MTHEVMFAKQGAPILNNNLYLSPISGCNGLIAKVFNNKKKKV
jgi:hypothetical protein